MKPIACKLAMMAISLAATSWGYAGKRQRAELEARPDNAQLDLSPT